jgi:hypothetical protein
LDGRSILLWFAGIISLFLGRAILWWSLPSIVFLLFMVRMPFRAELALSYTHQTATRWSGLAEFGDAGTLPRQVERLLDGKHCLEDLFGCEIAWFIPPWNSYGNGVDGFND